MPSNVAPSRSIAARLRSLRASVQMATRAHAQRVEGVAEQQQLRLGVDRAMRWASAAEPGAADLDLGRRVAAGPPGDVEESGATDELRRRPARRCTNGTAASRSRVGEQAVDVGAPSTRQVGGHRRVAVASNGRGRRRPRRSPAWWRPSGSSCTWRAGEGEGFEPHDAHSFALRSPAMRVVSCNSFGPGRPTRGRGASVGAARRRATVRIAVTACGRELRRRAHRAGAVPAQAAAAVRAGRRGRRRRQPRSATASRRSQVGDRVFATTGLSGGYASEVVRPGVPRHAHARQRHRRAGGDVRAELLHRVVRAAPAGHVPQAGEWLLVLGAGGGVGLAAVDVGRSMGLTVIAAASSADEARAARSTVGAEAVIDTSTEDVKTRAKELSGGGSRPRVRPGRRRHGRGRRCARCATTASCSSIGFASGEIPQLPANQILLRNRRVTGVDWGGWTVTHGAENKQMLAEVIAAVGRGRAAPGRAAHVPAGRRGRGADRPARAPGRGQDRAAALSERHCTSQLFTA